tara:strand:- start:1094 stop:1360 length:267 start_codon:yes stop_codon:yes gene_type:complete
MEPFTHKENKIRSLYNNVRAKDAAVRRYRENRYNNTQNTVIIPLELDITNQNPEEHCYNICQHLMQITFTQRQRRQLNCNLFFRPDDE